MSTCPKCGCKIMDPFRGNTLIHDIKKCSGIANSTLCDTCKQADVSCPIYPQITQTCVEYRKDNFFMTPVIAVAKGLRRTS